MRSFVVAKVIIVNQNNEILLLRRSKTDTRRPGQWDLPGGWVDEGEEVGAAAVREAQEEAGINLTAPRLIFAMSEVSDDSDSGTWIAFTERVTKTPAVQLSFEHDAFEWVPIAQVLSKMEYHRWQKMLQYIVANKLLQADNDANA
ncbi:MAG TPA: NUDIX hydrolase [Nevskiaceae bacterium]|nr:NUDIX hydrolase [Nevskiaceae bacterium]